ncbi:MAG TPA: UvrD-helicase domain-containing protein, partial [Acidimicrobiales bacterium]
MGSSIESTVGLTAAQRDAVVADDPVLCVLAGAGTGKTRVLTLRVARRAGDRSARADRVLVCTFSRKAADELRRRLWSLGVGDVRAGTFHRTALGLLRQYRADRGGPAPSVLPDRRALLADVLADPVAADGPRRRPGGRRLPRVV